MLVYRTNAAAAMQHAAHDGGHSVPRNFCGSRYCCDVVHGIGARLIRNTYFLQLHRIEAETKVVYTRVTQNTKQFSLLSIVWRVICQRARASTTSESAHRSADLYAQFSIRPRAQSRVIRTVLRSYCAVMGFFLLCWCGGRSRGPRQPRSLYILENNKLPIL